MGLVIGEKITRIAVIENAMFQVQRRFFGWLLHIGNRGHRGIASATTKSDEGSHKSQRSYDFSKSYAHAHPLCLGNY
jgi:hypothetical protein